MTECSHCGSQFSVDASRAKYNRGKYCSRACQYKQIHLDRTSLSSCQTCGIEFRHKKSIKRVFCSNACRLKKQENPLVSFYCAYCGSEHFYAEFNFERERRYCSRECSDLDRSIKKRGSNSHFWRGGLTSQNNLLRNSAKTKTWRKEVFSRDDYTCQKCGDRNGRGKTVYLEAHHIKRWSEYSDLRWNVDNGITLCKTCHRKTDNFGRKK